MKRIAASTWDGKMYAALRRHEEFHALDQLRGTGPLPLELEQRHQKLRRQEFYKAGLKADCYPPSTSSRLVRTDMTVADWLKERWASADETIRSSLLLLADALGIDIPLTRKRRNPAIQANPAPVPDEFEPTRHTSHDDLPDPSGKEAGQGPPAHRAAPEWHDDASEGWEPAESLHDALHPDEDRGWY